MSIAGVEENTFTTLKDVVIADINRRWLQFLYHS